jgi:predicted metal-dependent phosphoesterase TrpH
VGLIDYAKAKAVTLLPGIEFSCDTLVDDVHIVALGCDWKHPFFGREYQNSIRSKIDGYRELCEILTQDGLAIDWQADILGDGKRDENAVQRKHIFEAMAQKGYVKEWSEAKLLVNKTKKYSVKRKKPDPVEIIKNIHEAGGIAILAHPYLIGEAVWQGEKVSQAEYIERLIEAGIDGIEASYPYDKTSYGGSRTPEELEEETRRLYTDRVAIISGGSDYHNEGKKGSKNPRSLGERGVTKEYFMGNALLRGLLS